jgi:hypothetical protein
MKVSIAGSTAKRSPSLTSSTFSILPNAVYTLSCQTSTSALSYPLNVFLWERASNGTLTKRNVGSATGTTGWATKTLTFTSGPLAESAYFEIYIYNGYGTAWIDDLKLVDFFGGRVPTPFGGSVTNDGGGLTQTASVGGLDFNARFTNAGTAIRVDATLTDSTGQDRAVEVSFRLPLDVTGWSWDKDFVTSSAILDGVRYENNNTNFAVQGRSRYPFMNVHGTAASFTLAVPLGPQMQRFAYDTTWGLRSVWDFGLSTAATKTRSKASWTFWIYTSTPKWGARAAAQKLYVLDAASYTSPLKLQGAWALPGSSKFLSQVVGFQDFGWGVEEGDPIQDIDFANDNGILAFHYLNPMNWFRQFPGYTQQPSYDVIVAALNADAASGTGTTIDGIPTKLMAQAVINSSPYDENGLYPLMDPTYFWYSGDLQAYPVSPDSEIPAPSMWSVVKDNTVDGRYSLWAGRGNHLDGIFLDNLTYPQSRIENYRRAHWAYSDIPLTFSYRTRKIMMYTGFSAAEFCRAMRAYLATKGMRLMGSANAQDEIWIAPGLDIIGGEVRGAEAPDQAYMRRTMAYGKNWSNLQVPATGAGNPSAAEVLAYLRQGLLLGYFPGFNGSYWGSQATYERDRAQFRLYMPLIRKVVAAGWRPVPYATSSDGSIYVERFDDQVGNTFYLTAQNSSTSTKSFQMTVDGASLGAGSGAITLKELVGNTAMSASRSGNNILFSDSLAAGETALYEMTIASGCDPTYGDLNLDGSVDSIDLVILSHYLVGNMTPGTVPFTAALSKADLDRSGSVDAVDLVVLQNYLAGNLPCLPK